MAISADELTAQVRLAEQALATGEWQAGFERFRQLSSTIVARVPADLTFDFNESLVLHRFADLGAQFGDPADSLAAYASLQRRGVDEQSRAVAAFKRLDLAVTAGQALIARSVFQSIATEIWPEPPPEDPDSAGWTSWEQTLPFAGPDRRTTLAQMYLAVGRMYHALRKLPASTRWYERGLHHVEGSSDALVAVAGIALLQATAINQLTAGELGRCDTTLAQARAAIAAEPLGASFAIAIRVAQVRLAIIRGALPAALGYLDEVESMAARFGQARVVCSCLIARAELLLLLNLLAEGMECLSRARSLARDRDTDLLAAISRISLLSSARAAGFVAFQSSSSIREMLENSAGDATPATTAAIDESAIVWSGNCLTDYEIRESAIYAKLDRDPLGALADVDDLWSDFSPVASALIAARLKTLRGLAWLRAGQAQSAAADLADASALLRDIGAERERYQAELWRARAYRELGDERADIILRENDARLERLTQGMTVEQRNAFIANKFTLAEEVTGVRIEQLLELKAQAHAHSRWSWRGLVTRLDYWRALHDFIADRDGEQQKRQAAAAAGREPIKALRGLLLRMLRHPWRNVTVGYVVLPDRAFMFEIRTGVLDCRQVDLGRVSVNLLQQSLMAGSGAHDFDGRAAHVCDALGVQALMTRLPDRITSITVIADGALHLIPFCALRFTDVAGRGRYVIERLAVNMHGVTMPPTADRPAGRTAVISAYTGADRALDEAGPSADTAAATLSNEWGVTCTRADRKRSCLEALNDAGVFYYFGHGHFDRNPDESGIEFAGDDAHTVLSLRDFDQVRLRRMQQAIILACESGDAIPFAGRWTVGIPQMLLRRGVRSVLAAMWETDPQTAGRISAVFLERAPTLGRAEALRQAQLAVLRSAPTRDPFWWAAFQLHGDATAPSF